MQRFFIEDEKVFEDKIVSFGENFIHLTKSLRAKIGERVIFCDKNGTDYVCTVSEITRKNMVLNIINVIKNTAEPTKKITLYQCVTKGEQMDNIVRRSVEMGITEIVPVMSRRCVVRLEGSYIGKRISRWQKIALSAAAQSGRGIVPNIAYPLTFAEAIDDMTKQDTYFMCYEDEHNHKISELEISGNNIAFLIGPEGGFSEEEVSFTQSKNINVYSLGPRILRAENAATFTLPIILLKGNEL